MAYNGSSKQMDAAAELGRNPLSKLLGDQDQIQPEYGDEQADAGRDCRDEQDWQPYPPS